MVCTRAVIPYELITVIASVSQASSTFKHVWQVKNYVCEYQKNTHDNKKYKTLFISHFFH